MTRAGKTKSRCRRIVGAQPQEYVVEVRADMLVMRPLRSRAGGAAEIGIKWGAIYVRAFLPPRRRRRRA